MVKIIILIVVFFIAMHVICLKSGATESVMSNLRQILYFAENHNRKVKGNNFYHLNDIFLKNHAY